MAAKELARVRTSFVEKVSKDMISQLLDDLLEDHVLNDGEKDSILEENIKTRDKARALLDAVVKKGDPASEKMIAHLKKRDSTLHFELGLSCSQPPQPAAQVKMETAGSTTLVRAADVFWNRKRKDPNVAAPQGASSRESSATDALQNKKRKDPNRYPVDENSMRNRVALLITNIKFIHLSNRHGAERDEENMETLLSGLRYEVVKHRNLTAQEINKALLHFSEHPKLKGTDSVVVVMMSHGKLGAVLGVNHKTGMSEDVFHIDNIYKHLGSENCPALLNKPKIIIIQACRGGQRGVVLVSDSANQGDSVSHQGAEGGMVEDALRYEHRERDFISLLSSTPDTASWRDPTSGSVFIQSIVEVFNDSVREDDIEKLFKKVRQRVSTMQISVANHRKHEKQMPSQDRCTLLKDFYFYPEH